MPCFQSLPVAMAEQLLGAWRRRFATPEDFATLEMCAEFATDQRQLEAAIETTAGTLTTAFQSQTLHTLESVMATSTKRKTQSGPVRKKLTAAERQARPRRSRPHRSQEPQL